MCRVQNGRLQSHMAISPGNMASPNWDVLWMWNNSQVFKTWYKDQNVKYLIINFYIDSTVRWKYCRYTGLNKNLNYNFYLFKYGCLKFKITCMANVFLLDSAALKGSLSGGPFPECLYSLRSWRNCKIWIDRRKNGIPHGQNAES